MYWRAIKTATLISIQHTVPNGYCGFALDFFVWFFVWFSENNQLLSFTAKRSQSQPPKSLPPTLNGTSGLANGNGSNGLVNGNGSNGLTAVNGNGSNSMVIQQPAPTIERHKKPSRVPSNGYHTYNSHRSSSQLQYPNESSLDKRNHMRDMKMVSEIIWTQYFYHQKCI